MLILTDDDNDNTSKGTLTKTGPFIQTVHSYGDDHNNKNHNKNDHNDDNADHNDDNQNYDAHNEDYSDT